MMIDFVRKSTAHIFVDELSESISVVGQDFHHLVNVLRVTSQQSISVASNGFVRGYVVEKALENKLVLQSNSDLIELSEKQIDIAVSLFKLDRLEWGISKAIETGASSITVGTTTRSSFSIPRNKKSKVENRLNALAKSACMQSRRSSLVEVNIVDSLIDHLKMQDNVVICEPGGEKLNLEAPICMAIGPEGGFDENELEELLSFSKKLELSTHILRSETALALAPAYINY